MTPIEKNITVVDEHGNEYEATYPKRARGLVKHGRARFITDEKICLACPPNTILEDKTMSNDNTPALTMEYLLGKIDQLASDTAYLHEAIAALQGMTHDSGECGSPGDIAGEEKAKALGSAVMCRETTNQQLIALYKQMYDGLKNPLASEDARKMEQLRQAAELFKGASATSMGSIRRLAEKMLCLPYSEDDD